MKFTDAAELIGARRTADGYLVAEAFAVRSGIQLYAGHEVGMADRDVVRVYRPESEVRAIDSMRTWAHAPVTLGHPDETVSSANWRDLAKGEVSTDAEWKDGKIRFPLIVKDESAIQAIAAGTRELSAGYTCDLAMESGITDDGEEYDGIQRRIRINHLAIVAKGRAGSECRIGDGASEWGMAPITVSDTKGSTMPDNMKTVVLGDKAAQVAASDAAIIEQYKADTAKTLADTIAAHDAALATRDAELAKRDAEIGRLKAAALTDAALDARVAARADLLDKAKLIARDVATVGLSDADIRRAVVKAKAGDAAVVDRSDDYVACMFDILAEDARSVDPVLEALVNTDRAQVLTFADMERQSAKIHAQNIASFANARKEG